MAPEQADLDLRPGRGAWARRLPEPGDLSVGQHTITFTADDGAGGVASASIVLNVLADPDELVAEDGLVVSPRAVRLYPERGQTVAVLTIENQNTAQAIGWAAAWNAAWLTLNPDDGTTPDEITVQCALVRMGRRASTRARSPSPAPRCPGRRCECAWRW